MSRITKDIRWGVKGGVVLGTILGVFAAVVILLKREPLPIHPILLLVLYPIGGVAAGFVTGLFRPLVTTRRTAMLVGSIAAFAPTVLILSLIEKSVRNWNTTDWIGSAFASFVVGCVAGAALWNTLGSSRDG